MKRLLPLFILCAISANAQSIVQRDNGRVIGYYSNASQINFEESVILKPDGPCKINKVTMYLGGSTQAKKDTILIVGDPAEGTIPPTQYVWNYNTLATAIVEYSGKPGWVTIDLSNLNIRSDGYDRICIQHTNDLNGPRFAIDDNKAATPLSSFLYDPIKNNSLNFPGIYMGTQGDFLVRLEVTYDFPKGTTSEKAPYPSLLEITQQAKLVGADGTPVKSARVSVADWNSDGFDDVAIGSQFFENLKDGTFKNVSETINISAGASVWGDINNDGQLDVYAVNGGTGDRIYKNNGDGTFTDITSETGISNPRPTVTPIWLDYDRDGNLDLFIANGRTEVAGQEEYFPDQLFKNNGDGTFKNVTDESGIALGEPEPLDCWGASAADYNNDGWVDIFVATYRLAPDKLFKNNGDGTFTEVGAATGVQGVATSEPGYFGHGIGADWGDYDNDGFMDLAVGNLGHPDWRGLFSNPSLIFKNNGGENFTEVHKDLGVKFFEMNAGAMWADFDLDGNLDLWHSQYSYSAASATEPKRLSRVYMNGGRESNYAFKDKTWELGAEIHGAWTQARTDFDNDGDIDILAASPHDGVRLFRNDTERKGNWVGFHLSPYWNGDALDPKYQNTYGTSIRVYAGGKVFKREIQGGGSGATATQNSNWLHFGLGNIERVDSIIIMHAGKRIGTDMFPANWLYTIQKHQGSLIVNNSRNPFPTPSLISPRNTEIVKSTKVTLNWSKAGRITSDDSYYYLQVALDSNFTDFKNNVIDTGISLKNHSFIVDLPVNTKYYWRVMHLDPGPYETPWSSVWSFTTSEPTSVENALTQENTLLKEASPNPVMDKTTINFEIEKAGEISLKIFDIAGTEIATLAGGNHEPGKYSVQWNAEDIPSGTYYYVLKTAAGSVSKKLVVQK